MEWFPSGSNVSGEFSAGAVGWGSSKARVCWRSAAYVRSRSRRTTIISTFHRAAGGEVTALSLVVGGEASLGAESSASWRVAVRGAANWSFGLAVARNAGCGVYGEQRVWLSGGDCTVVQG